MIIYFTTRVLFVDELDPHCLRNTRQHLVDTFENLAHVSFCLEISPGMETTFTKHLGSPKSTIISIAKY